MSDADRADLLDFADLIGPGGSGLSRDKGGVTDEDSDDGLDGLLDEFEDLAGESDENGFSDADQADDDGSEEDDLDVDLAESEVEPEDEDEDETALPAAPKEEADGATPALTKYVPPHMRAAMLAEKAQGSKDKSLDRQKLERKTQGLLNKYVRRYRGELTSGCPKQTWRAS